MTLKSTLECGKDLGLETVGEALHNIQLHAPSIFAYSELASELNELEADAERVPHDAFIVDILKEL